MAHARVVLLCKAGGRVVKGGWGGGGTLFSLARFSSVTDRLQAARM